MGSIQMRFKEYLAEEFDLNDYRKTVTFKDLITSEDEAYDMLKAIMLRSKTASTDYRALLNTKCNTPAASSSGLRAKQMLYDNFLTCDIAAFAHFMTDGKPIDKEDGTHLIWDNFTFLSVPILIKIHDKFMVITSASADENIDVEETVIKQIYTGETHGQMSKDQFGKWVLFK